MYKKTSFNMLRQRVFTSVCDAVLLQNSMILYIV